MSRALRLMLCLLLCAVAGAAAAQTRAWLDRDRIALGETTTLNIETDANAAPDYAPLLPDFDLSGQASQQQMTWTNGSVSARSLYAVALRPRRDGLLRIPALRVGGRATSPLTLLVTPAPAGPETGSGDVFIESEADAQDPYVQQAVGWTVRLYSAIPLIAGQLDQPAPAGASLQRIGDDVQFRRTLGSRSYVVTERRYLLIPERSGELVIPPARFEGRGTGNAFDRLFGDGQQALQATARPRVLKIRPIPADAPQPWLPLRLLSMRYLGAPKGAQAGRAVDVTVEVIADGATASQLPDITLAAADGAQVFPERPRSEESIAGGRPQVRLQRRFSVVPARAGTLVLPGPRIAWWDTRAGAARTATLPPLKLQVAPGAVPEATGDEPSRSPDGVPAARAMPPWMLAGLAGVALLLIAAGLAWRHRSADRPVEAVAASPSPQPVLPESTVAPAHDMARSQRPAPASGAPPAASPPVATPDLAKALEGGDLAAIETALRMLAGGAADLDDVIRRLDDASQREAVEHLRRARWADGDAALARTRLRGAFAAGPRWRRPPSTRDEALPPLYPEA